MSAERFRICTASSSCEAKMHLPDCPQSASRSRVSELAATIQAAVDASFHATGPPYGFTHAQYDEAYIALPALVAIALSTEAARQQPTPDFCGDHQLAHGPHEFIRGARRYDCPGCPPPESSQRKNPGVSSQTPSALGQKPLEHPLR